MRKLKEEERLYGYDIFDETLCAYQRFCQGQDLYYNLLTTKTSSYIKTIYKFFKIQKCQMFTKLFFRYKLNFLNSNLLRGLSSRGQIPHFDPQTPPPKKRVGIGAYIYIRQTIC
jgi:hypothetical protein